MRIPLLFFVLAAARADRLIQDLSQACLASGVRNCQRFVECCRNRCIESPSQFAQHQCRPINGGIKKKEASDEKAPVERRRKRQMCNHPGCHPYDQLFAVHSQPFPAWPDYAISGGMNGGPISQQGYGQLGSAIAPIQMMMLDPVSATCGCYERGLGRNFLDQAIGGYGGFGAAGVPAYGFNGGAQFNPGLGGGGLGFQDVGVQGFPGPGAAGGYYYNGATSTTTFFYSLPIIFTSFFISLLS